MFNLSVYIGALIDGIKGGFLCFISLFVPAFLFIWTILPYYQAYRSNIRVSKFIKGVCCASMGLILSAVIILYISASKREDFITTFIIAGIG